MSNTGLSELDVKATSLSESGNTIAQALSSPTRLKKVSESRREILKE